jgi:FkbM family methyltransferase
LPLPEPSDPWHTPISRWIPRLREAIAYRALEMRRRLWRHRLRPLTVRLPEGPALRLHPDSRLAEILVFEDFEVSERTLVSRFLRGGDVFVDVGANFGLFTVIAARRVGPAGHVYAFEPVAPTYSRLQENVLLNNCPNVDCIQLGLSDRSGPAQMTVSLDGFDAWNSLGRPTRGEKLAQREIACTTWDEFCKEQQVRRPVTLMKIDVEGWESRVLRGGVDNFSGTAAPTLLLEFSDAAAHQAGTSCQELFGLTGDLGYQLFSFDNGCKLHRETLRAEYPYVNLLALKDIDFVQERLRGSTYTP